nr:reverse transcriptase domain-containing protein [Tanacetum cinerariifolium]
LRVLGEKPEEKVRQLMSVKAKEKNQEEIELVPGAKPVAKPPCRLAPFELEELSGQLKELYDKGDVEPKQIIHDPDDQPMWESAKTIALTLNSAIVQITIDENFVINSTHLKMIRENKFDGYLRADPHNHIREFLAICNMLRYSETQSEAVKLLMFSFSLCDEAKTWFNELNEESITS